APGQPRRRAVLVGQAPHVNGPIDDRPVAGQRQAALRTTHRLDAQIDVGRQAPVQAHLVLAEAAARPRVAEVEEPEADWPLDLPDVAATQEHPRRVSRADLVGSRLELRNRTGGVCAHGCNDRPATLRRMSLASSTPVTGTRPTPSIISVSRAPR